MFSKEIVCSDAFQDMPATSQLLYFHLGMEADDDGFIGNPKKIARSIGMAEDDLKILISKRFVLLFDSGVLVIKHHRINNNWDKYNCRRTMYLEEFSQLYLKPNKAYTLDKTQGTSVQTENSLKTVYRIEENRREENIYIPANAGYKNKSDRIFYESERTFKDKAPAMSFLMGLVKRYGEGPVLGAIGGIRESGKIPKEPTAYLQGIFIAKQKQGLIAKMQIK